MNRTGFIMNIGQNGRWCARSFLILITLTSLIFKFVSYIRIAATTPLSSDDSPILKHQDLMCTLISYSLHAF